VTTAEILADVRRMLHALEMVVDGSTDGKTRIMQ